MLRRVAVVRTDFSEELISSIIWVTAMGELETKLSVIISYRSMLQRIRLLVTANVPSKAILVTLMMEAIRSSEASILA
jgi:hypothetical protein